MKITENETMRRIIVAVAVLASVAGTGLISATAPSFAQSRPNYGPNWPDGGDTYGEPYSGSAGARQRSGGW